MIINAIDTDFNEKVIEKSKEIPIVVDFWADWCPPCTILGPVLEKVVEEYKEKFILVKVNVNQAQERSKEYKITSIPNVKMFKDGRIVDEFIGSMPEDSVKEWLNKNLEK